MRGLRRSGRRIAAVAVACIALAGLTAPLAGAASGDGFTVESFAVNVTNPGGGFSRQAGAHPDLRTDIKFTWDQQLNGGNGALIGNAKDVGVDLPVGLIGDPTAVPTCAAADLAKLAGGSDCPVKSIVGYSKTYLDRGFGYPSPIYNLQHGSDSPALFGFVVINVPVFVEPHVRSGDYGISSFSIQSSQAEPVSGVDLTFWGVPGDPSHDWQRGREEQFIPSPVGQTPFLTSPTSCPNAPQPFTANATSWQAPQVNHQLTVDAEPDGTPFVFGCERLPFRPNVTVETSAHSTGGPTGTNVTIKVPQNRDPYGLGTANVKSTVITFPQGFTVSSSSAAGQGTCSEAEIAIGANTAPACPSSSRVGSVRVKSPVVEEELEGGLYLAKPRENPFGSLIAFYLAVKGPGIYLKIPGQIETDPQTGQVVARFDNQPQVPYEEVNVTLRGGASGVLLAPKTCGTYQLGVDMVSWASPTPVHLNTPAKIDENCGPRGFKPGLRAGTTNPVAGTYSPFTLQATRNDGEQNLQRFEAHLPQGLLGKLAGVTVCGDADAASGNCPANSQVGTVTVGAGFGSNPLYIPEEGHAPTALYLAALIRVRHTAWWSRSRPRPDPSTSARWWSGTRSTSIRSRPSTVSDPLPQILEGIPVEYRDLRVEIRRPNFILNPTSCKQLKISATITSNEGQTANPSTPFQMADCERLGFGPNLAVKLTGPDSPLRLPGAENGADRAARRRQHQPRRSDPAEDRVPRELAHPDDLHPGPVRREQLPAALDLRLCQGLVAVAGPAGTGPGLPALEQPRTTGPGGLARRSDARRPLRPDRLGQCPDPQHLRLRPRRAGEQIRPHHAGRQEGVAGQQHRALQDQAGARRQVLGLQRQGPEDQPGGQGGLRQAAQEQEAQEEGKSLSPCERRSSPWRWRLCSPSAPGLWRRR